ncbi:hypothetical protein B0T18DRAFT_388852 [Schizothecium vesticola]|uniref:Uncharacterized protein n=1 Tax=Schizothecium vesticola TaxID=314040 RepID=A0AA40F120_9PEZI|nr:hypothetical protein B0T18DRAFT_388852 [Schizothecium vesticola]
MEASNAGPQRFASGRGGPRPLAQQPSTPFYSAPDSWTSSLSSYPSTAEYSLPGTSPGIHGDSGFGLSVANTSDSMIVERGSPPLPPSFPIEEGRGEDQGKLPLGDRNNVLATTSSPTQGPKATVVDEGITHGRKNEKGSEHNIPTLDDYPSRRHDLSRNHPLSGPPYPSQFDDNDLGGLHSVDANALESRITHRQQASGTLTFASTSRDGDAVVDNDFVFLPPTDGKEDLLDWVKVRRQKRDS